MANNNNVILELTKRGLIDERQIYCIGSVNKIDIEMFLGGAFGAVSSAMQSLVCICVNRSELIVAKPDMETRILTCAIEELKVEKLKTGILGGGKFVFRYNGKKMSLDCTNDFIKAFAPLVGVAL